MSDRTRRVGSNEAVFREVNEQIEGLNRGVAAISDGMMHIVCECGDLLCAKQLSVPTSKYEAVRADSELFFVVAGHEQLDIEDVVEQTSEFNVVRKRAPEAAQIAAETDPRS
jgi:hypothetical protein